MEDILQYENTEPEVVNISNPEDIIALYPDASLEEVEKIRTNVTKDIEKAKKGEQIIYGLKIGGKIVATAQLQLIHDKLEYADGEKRVRIYHMRTAEEFRGKGLATKLMEIAEEEAKKRNFKELSLGVEENNMPALTLYKKLGFQEYMRETDGNGKTVIGMLKKFR